MMRAQSDHPSFSVVLVSVGGLCLIWVLAAWVTDDPAISPGPAEVWRIAVMKTQSGALPHHLFATLARVIAAFVLAMVFGTLFGLHLGFYPRLNRGFGPWLIVILTIPAVVKIFLCYLWIGLNEVAVVTAVALNKMAMVSVTLREGVHALDPKLGPVDIQDSHRL